MKTSPDIDCVFLNAGVQRSWDFSRPETVDLKEYNKEVDVNYISFVALTHAFLPFLISKSLPTSLI
jgi:short-subunit dehydrogenase involved in D-alanine esterification of teichoic acids